MVSRKMAPLPTRPIYLARNATGGSAESPSARGFLGGPATTTICKMTAAAVSAENHRHRRRNRRTTETIAVPSENATPFALTFAPTLAARRSHFPPLLSSSKGPLPLTAPLDVANLSPSKRRHVERFHKASFQEPRAVCGRCREGFATQADLDAHVRVEDVRQICPVRSPDAVAILNDPEDGISAAVHSRLRDRTAKGQVLNWRTLWTTLFPGDPVVPDSGKIG